MDTRRTEFRRALLWARLAGFRVQSSFILL
jgi:hypothetical protein